MIVRTRISGDAGSSVYVGVDSPAHTTERFVTLTLGPGNFAALTPAKALDLSIALSNHAREALRENTEAGR